MQYQRFGEKIIVRIDRGEEIVRSLQAVCVKEGVTLATVSALGAVGKFTVGVFKTAEKKYCANSFEGDYEIVSLTGTFTTKEGALYAHLHMSAGDEKGRVFGGHLNEAFVSATCEAVLGVTEGRVERAFDEEVGLNLMKFE